MRKMLLCSLFAALHGLCAWLSIPLGTIRFTMQTFSVFLSLEVLGGKWGTGSILVYLLLGAAGVPVFSGFQGGLYPLLGPTGGFLWGFAVAGLVYWALEGLSSRAMVPGLLACYGCGCGWFLIYAPGTGLWAAVLHCVVPYLVPDIIKLLLARRTGSRLRRQLK